VTLETKELQAFGLENAWKDICGFMLGPSYGITFAKDTYNTP
jgi:hypothetical protein